MVYHFLATQHVLTISFFCTIYSFSFCAILYYVCLFLAPYSIVPFTFMQPEKAVLHWLLWASTIHKKTIAFANQLCKEPNYFWQSSRSSKPTNYIKRKHCKKGTNSSFFDLYFDLAIHTYFDHPTHGFLQYS